MLWLSSYMHAGKLIQGSRNHMHLIQYVYENKPLQKIEIGFIFK